MLAARDCAAMTHALQPIRHHIDAMVVPCKQAAALAAERRAVVPHDACAGLVLAWHHEHLVYHSGAKPKRSHQQERDCGWACAAGLLGDAFDPLQALVFDKLDAIVRAASWVEMVKALFRPYLHSCKGQLTQEACNLIMFSHHHRRYKSGKRQGKAPIELLTGKPMEAPWWELGRQQVHTAQGVTAPGALPTRPPLQLVTNNDGGTAQQAPASGQASIAPTGAAEHERRHKDSQAAEEFHRFCNTAILSAVSARPNCAYSSHTRDLIRDTVNYFCPVLQGA
jgi:hypothetical protein